jgi:CelD/BcsL family acetyltransferase involved in cellulose biosynthesis
LDPQPSLDSLPGWEELYRTAGTLPTQSPAWTDAALSAFGGEARLLSSGEDGLQALAPLVRHGSTLELAAGRELGEPADLLSSSPAALTQLAEQIVAQRRPLLLRRVPAGSPTVQALGEALGGRGRLQLGEAEGHPTIALDERWAEPGGGLSSSRRSSLRRARRKAEKLGEIEVELLAPEPGQVDSLLDVCFAVEARSWKREAGTAVAVVPAMEAFFRRFATEAADRGALRIDLLRIGGEPVAMQLGMVWDERHWLFKIGYDESFASASPGQILVGESVAAAARAGLTAYELLGSRDAWTDVWTKEIRECAKVLLLPRSPHSLLALGAIGRRGAQRRAKERAQRGKERLLEKAKARYVAGPELDAALAVEARAAAAGYETTVGFWNSTSTPKDKVLAEAIESAKRLRANSEVSIKLPAMGGDSEDLDGLLALCEEEGVTLHIDALGPDSAGANQAAALRLAEGAPGRVGCTLPSRWARSAADAGALADRPVRVRLVKGEVEDPEGGEVAPREGYLALAKALAGREHLVEVATQDARLARLALGALLADGTPCELQVLHGMRTAKAIGVAKKLGVAVRVYVPYGNGRLPFRRAQLQRSPALLFQLATDLSPLPSRRVPGT